MSIFTRVVSAFRAGFRAFSDPETRALDLLQADPATVYAHYWSYYDGSIYSKRTGDAWGVYLRDRQMYKHTRLIYNMVPQIVDFYVDNIWRLAANDKYPLLVTPVRDNTDAKLIEAIAQLDQWSNFESESHQLKKYAAATGNVMAEIVDDLERQKVLQVTHWPGRVKDFEVNNTGDLQSYILEYDVWDADKKVTFRYKKVVTKESFSYFYNDRPYTPPGETAPEKENPYGFCPAVMIRHAGQGGSRGVPAVKQYDKVDELAMLAAHLHDNIHREIESPKIIATDGRIKSITGTPGTGEEDSIDEQDPRLHHAVMKVGADGKAFDLSSTLKLNEAFQYLEMHIKSFTDDYPELQAAAIIRENSQLSGAALERMLGPAQNRLNGVQPNYNMQLVKLRQMQIAIAGYRTRSGWFSLNDQQRKFQAFDLNSYQDGDLDFQLKNSVLVQTTELEDEELLKAKAERAAILSEWADPRASLEVAGFDKKKIDEILKRVEEEEPDEDVVTQARQLENGGVRPRQLPASTAAEMQAVGK